MHFPIPAFAGTAGDTFRLRATARRLIPAAECSRRTSRTLRMDNLLFATVGPSSKAWKGPTVTGCPASLSSWGQAPCTIAVRTAKVITFPPESLITLGRIR